MIGVAVAAAVLIALPLFAPTADFFAGLVGGAVGGLAGLAATALHRFGLGRRRLDARRAASWKPRSSG